MRNGEIKMCIHTKLAEIQRELKAPKNQYNSFGKYKYRSCEDILEGVKPLLGDVTLTLSDDIVQVGNRIYVKAKATLKDKEGELSATGWARESETKKGMDDSQITGSTSSYARKYALNGLFCIDDTKDADTDEHKNHQATKKEPPAEQKKAKAKEWADSAKQTVSAFESIEDLNAWQNDNLERIDRLKPYDDIYKDLGDLILKRTKELCQKPIPEAAE